MNNKRGRDIDEGDSKIASGPQLRTIHMSGMAATTSQSLTASVSSRSSPAVNGSASFDYVNGHGDMPDSPGSNVTPAPAPVRKMKKKTTDPNETSKLLAAKINQLELDQAGDKEQELEIGA